MDPIATIAHKRDGRELTAQEITEFVDAFTAGQVPDYQMSALLMAWCLRGSSPAEVAALTDAMLGSGERLDLSGLLGPTVDKHSTGGVADGTTLVVAPLAAELGMKVLKLSGRGLGHTGGTLDKLESIPGLRTDLSPDAVLRQVEAIGLAVGAQTADLVPADRAIYALRDQTATVGDVALIASSIMSKKLAGGASSIVLDVKTGSGAFMKELDAARELARTCIGLGTRAGRDTAAVISDMSQPLGDMIGNAVEVQEAIEVLRGERAGRLRDLSLRLVGLLAAVSGTAPDPAAGTAEAEKALASGAGLERFARFVEAQGGDPHVVDQPDLLPSAPVRLDVPAPAGGWLAAVDAERVGLAASHLGAGRSRKEDPIDPAVGIVMPTKIGDRVEPGEVVATILARTDTAAATAADAVRAALHWSSQPVTAPPLLHDTLR